MCLEPTSRERHIISKRGGPTLRVPLCRACLRRQKKRDRRFAVLILIVALIAILIVFLLTHGTKGQKTSDLIMMYFAVPGALVGAMAPIYWRFGCPVEVSVLLFFDPRQYLWIRFRNRAYTAVYLDFIRASGRETD